MKFEQLKTEQVNEQSLNLDILSPLDAARLMNEIDSQTVKAVECALPAIAKCVEEISARMKKGGRLIYMGAGTSGRMGVLDASECPPTFGVDEKKVIGLIAGGDTALRSSAESAEDSEALGAQALREIGLSSADSVVGISASGYAPYCVGGLDYAKEAGALRIALSCNDHPIMAAHADISIEMPTGPEIVSGSTRLKAGTATKMALNMLSTLTMVQLGKVYRNLMVDMKPSNHKLQDRSIRIIQNALNGIDREQAEKLYLEADHSVKAAIVMGETGTDMLSAQSALAASGGFVRAAIQSLKK